MTSKIETIYGTHAVLAAWQNPSRICHRLYVSEKSLNNLPKDQSHLIKRPKPIIKDPKFFKSFFKDTTVHQNMILECAIIEQPNLTKYLSHAKEKDLVIILDQIQDPQNLGSIIRTATAFNAGAIILQEQNSASITPSAIKVATGAYEHMPIIHVNNLNQTIKTLKDAEYWVAAFAESGSQFLHEYKPANKNVVLMGAEGPGLRDLLLKNADMILKLPTCDKQSSINVANATAIAIYEFSKTC